MADQNKTYGIKITADLGDLKSEAAAGAKAIEGIGKAAQGAGTQASAALGNTTKSAKELQSALRGVPAQFTDIATSLAAGQSPLQVLLQQGGQLKDMFGGIGPAAKALGGYLVGLVNPYSVAALATGALAAAWHQGQQEATEFAKALILSGNASRTSVGELQALAASVAQATGATQGRAAEVLAQIVSGGKIAASALEAVATAAIAMEKVGGAAAEETIKDFEALGKAPAETARKLSENTRAFSLEVYAQIKALTEQGKTAEAAAVAQKAYSDIVVQRAQAIAESLGPLEKAWTKVKEEAGKAWDRMRDVGREDSPEARIEQARRNVAQLEQQTQQRSILGGDSVGFDNSKGLAEARERLATLEREEAERQAINAHIEEEAKLTQQAKNFIDDSASATDKAAASTSALVNLLRTGYLATLHKIAEANPGKDPLNTADGIIATEKYKAKLTELAAEINKTAIAGQQALKSKLQKAFESGRTKAEELRKEIASLNAELAKVASGQGEFGLKAQERRDKNLTPEQAESKNTRAAQNAIDEARRLSVFAQNAAIDGRAEQAQDYARQAADLMKTAASASDKIADNDVAARMFEQLNAVQQQSLQAQKAIKEQQLAEQQAQTAAQAEELAKLEERLAALKSGATIKVEVPTDAAVAQAQAIQAAIDAIPTQKTVTVTVQQVGGASGDAAPADLPARAYGGPLPGHAPHDRADNRLFWGTPGEWVIQRPTVRYYGDDFMRRLNAQQIPKYAFGGEIGRMSGAAAAVSSQVAGRLSNLAIPHLPPALARVMEARDLVMQDGSRYPIQTEQDVGAAIERHLARAALRVGRRR